VAGALPGGVPPRVVDCCAVVTQVTVQTKRRACSRRKTLWLFNMYYTNVNCIQGMKLDCDARLNFDLLLLVS